jgi:hypothetical protein
MRLCQGSRGTNGLLARISGPCRVSNLLIQLRDENGLEMSITNGMNGGDCSAGELVRY